MDFKDTPKDFQKLFLSCQDEISMPKALALYVLDSLDDEKIPQEIRLCMVDHLFSDYDNSLWSLSEENFEDVENKRIIEAIINQTAYLINHLDVAFKSTFRTKTDLKEGSLTKYTQNFDAHLYNYYRKTNDLNNAITKLNLCACHSLANMRYLLTQPDAESLWKEERSMYNVMRNCDFFTDLLPLEEPFVGLAMVESYDPIIIRTYKKYLDGLTKLKDVTASLDTYNAVIEDAKKMSIQLMRNLISAYSDNNDFNGVQLNNNNRIIIPDYLINEDALIQ